MYTGIGITTLNDNNIEKQPFRSYQLDEEKVEIGAKVLAVRLNKEEQARLQQDMKILHQPKDSTALKMLAELGSNVLHDQNTALLLETIFKNRMNNRRVGITEFEP